MSIRRIISAYLNYPDSAEEDVKRCERSYRKLPPAHKGDRSENPSPWLGFTATLPFKVSKAKMFSCVACGIWDAVVTCFFIDTAHNIIEYIEIISKILKDGGVWINWGPLLHHFADMYGEDEMSIELSLEDVKRVAVHYGFQFEKEKTIETTYTTNPRLMMQNRYYAAFWAMRKKSATTKEQHSNT